jgi:hypothetical protein
MVEIYKVVLKYMNNGTESFDLFCYFIEDNRYLVQVRELCTHNAIFPPIFLFLFCFTDPDITGLYARCVYPFPDTMIWLFHALCLI